MRLLSLFRQQELANFVTSWLFAPEVLSVRNRRKFETGKEFHKILFKKSQLLIVYLSQNHKPKGCFLHREAIFNLLSPLCVLGALAEHGWRTKHRDFSFTWEPFNCFPSWIILMSLVMYYLNSIFIKAFVTLYERSTLLKQPVACKLREFGRTSPAAKNNLPSLTQPHRDPSGPALQTKSRVGTGWNWWWS